MVGNRVTVTFTSSEILKTATMTIAGHNATMGGGGTSWNGTYDMVSGDAEGPVAFSISFTDLAGNAGTAVTGTSDGSSVTFDSSAPISTISFPVNSGSYTITAWQTISGGTTDNLSGVNKVEVSIEDANTGQWWNGSAGTFSDNNESWWSVSGTTSWTYTLAVAKLTPGHHYQVSSCATDNAGNVETPSSGSSFLFLGSSDNSLANLTISQGTLSPTFGSGQTSYTATVAYGVDSITVTPTVHQDGATITVNGQAVNSGEASQAISLNKGSNTITIVVTAQDGIAQLTYTITVTRNFGIFLPLVRR
jgi:hypothetical protein